MNKFKYHYIRLKRRLSIWLSQPNSYFSLIRYYEKRIRLNNIRKQKSIYDLTDMD